MQYEKDKIVWHVVSLEIEINGLYLDKLPTPPWQWGKEKVYKELIVQPEGYKLWFRCRVYQNEYISTPVTRVVLNATNDNRKWEAIDRYRNRQTLPVDCFLQFLEQVVLPCLP